MPQVHHSTEWSAIFDRLDEWNTFSGRPIEKGFETATRKACRRAMSVVVTLADIAWPLLSMKQDGKGGIVIEGACFNGNKLMRRLTREFRIEPDGSCARCDLEGGNVWQFTPINKPLAA